jgi:Zn-dependent M28 family amino/carboxypeptidase
MNNNVVFLLTSSNAVKYQVNVKHIITESPLSNVVAMIPGKTRPDEFVIFSAHYDHLGIGKPNSAGDSIYNGANDDAAGTTAMMLLASYFNKIKSNARTLIFAAFTAEESGLYGSSYFSTQINPDKVVAMFNIEMIGTESKWGKNSAFITGFERSDMGKILQQNLAKSSFKFEPDPYPKQNLFYRSDNATLAALGVPAHTISTSKMDNEKFYHTQDDEIETLDIKNMTEIIKAIAFSSKTIISGKDTPSRVEKQ